MRRSNGALHALPEGSGEHDEALNLPAERVDRIGGVRHLRNVEAQSRYLFEANPAATWIYDPQSLRLLAINEAAVSQYGYSREEFLSLTLRDIVQADETENVAGGQPGSRPHFQGRSRHLRKDGSVVTAAIYTAPVFFEGRPARISTVFDVTDRECAENRARDCAATFALAQRLAHIGSWEVDLTRREKREHNPFRCSDETLRILGVQPVSIDVSRRTLLRFFHPDDRERIGAAFRRQIRTGAAFDMEGRIIRPGGEERIVHVQSETVLNDNGIAVRTVGTIRDVTEKKQAERLLREQAELINLAQDAIMVVDLNGTIHLWNKAAARIYGWAAEEAVGKNVANLVAESSSKVLENVTDATLRDGAWAGEVEHQRKNGPPARLTSRWTLLRDEKGKAKSFLIINTDVTAQRRWEQQILRAQRLESIGTLASGVAHDLNNILAPIVMATPLLRMQTAPPEARERLLNIIEASARRGAGVVKQILTFARGANGERVLIQPIHLIKEIATAVETFPKSIVIRPLFPQQQLPAVMGDPVQLHQVLLNLCVNARDAMPNGGELTISAENFEVDEHYASMTAGATAGAHVMFRVTDTGTGIPRHIIDKIFDPFFTTKEIGQGTGLGLSTSIGIVKSHGGFLNVYSESGGSTFKLFLPAATASEAPLKPKPPIAPPRGHGETILVVDDEPGLRHVAEAVLVEHGYKVMMAEDGIEALSVFARSAAEIKLIVTDLAMPFLDGLTFARTVRKMEPKTNVIISTGRDDDLLGSGVNALHVDDVLTKPYTRETLLNTVARVLNAAANGEGRRIVRQGAAANSFP